MKKIDISTEIRNRIRLSVAAYAYEFDNASIMTDAEFDKLSLEIDPSIETGNKLLDDFFKKHFDPSTGSWIWKHPERLKVKGLYDRYYKRNKK